MAHARNAPSDSKRWLLCPGALNRCKTLGLKDDGGNTASREGTAAHWVRETCLELGLDPYDFIGTRIAVEGETFVCDDGMASALQDGIDQIRRYDGPLFIELRVNITPWTGLDEDGNEQFGTLDAGVVGKDLIVISDLKYGANIPVEAIKNFQQVIYALGFYEQVAKHLTKATKFLIIIDQPRNSAGGGEWPVTLEELQKLGEWIKERAKLTFDPNAPCIASKEACTWCPAAKALGQCAEYDQWQTELFEADLDDLDDFVEFGTELKLPDPEVLTPERLGVIYQHRSIMKKFIERVEALVKRDVLQGRGEDYGLKAVAGKRSPRKHRDGFESEMWLFENGYKDAQIINRQLKTPSQLDKVCGRGKFPEDLIIGGNPTPTIVSIEDARLALPVENFIDEEVEDLDDFE